MTVEIGVLLPTREAVMSGRPETAPLLAMAERAEASGLWHAEHSSCTRRPASTQSGSVTR